MSTDVKDIIENINKKLDALERDHKQLAEKIILKRDEIKSLEDSIQNLQNLQNALSK